MNKYLIKFFGLGSTSWCAAFLCLFAISCCRDNPVENPYKWKIDRWEHVYLDPHYEDGYYYVFSEDYDTHQSYLTKIKEIDGKVLYSNPFKVGVDLDLKATGRIFSKNGNLVFVEGKYFHQFNKTTGQLVTTDTFTNYIWDFNVTKDHVTACSYTDGLKSFKYFEVVLENGHFKEKLIHEEFYDHMNNARINGGTAPINANGKWIMPYFTAIRNTGESKNYLILNKDGKSDITSIGYDNFEGKIWGGSYVSDEIAGYFFCSDKLFAIDKITQDIKWSVKVFIPTTPIIVGDYIYIITGISIDKMAIVNKHTGAVELIDSPTGYGAQLVGEYICFTSGDFCKFDTKTRKLVKGPLADEAEVLGGWGYSIGVTPNSKLLFDLKSWECFPF
jgi:hypothetical protein